MIHKFVFFIVVFCVFHAHPSFAQSKMVRVDSTTQYEKPFPSYNFVGYINHNIKYPKSARDKGIQGIVKVRFIVNEDGTISNASVAQHLEDELDSEAVKAVGNMPAWNPAMKEGKPLRVYFTEPVSFRLK